MWKVNRNSEATQSWVKQAVVITSRLKGQKNITLVEPMRSRVSLATMVHLPGKSYSHRWNVTPVAFSLRAEKKRDICPIFSFNPKPRPQYPTRHSSLEVCWCRGIQPEGGSAHLWYTDEHRKSESCVGGQTSLALPQKVQKESLLLNGDIYLDGGKNHCHCLKNYYLKKQTEVFFLED